MRTVRQFDAQRVRLEAMESLLTFERIATGTGSIGHMGKQVIQRWKAETGSDDEPAPRIQWTPEQLRAMGIRVFGPKSGAV